VTDQAQLAAVAEVDPIAQAAERRRLLGATRRALLFAVSSQVAMTPTAIDIDTELARYGFDSIRFAALARVLKKRYGFDSSFRMFFANRTIRDLSDHLVASQPEAAASLVELLERSGESAKCSAT
jgi:aryl carrier-like protein